MFNRRTPLNELEAFHNPHHRPYGYVRDRDYRRLAIADINTLEAALRLCDELDQERRQADGGDSCQKARSIRTELAQPRWQDKTGIGVVLSVNRRVGCSCHETGSYAPRHKP